MEENRILVLTIKWGAGFHRGGAITSPMTELSILKERGLLMKWKVLVREEKLSSQSVSLAASYRWAGG